MSHYDDPHTFIVEGRGEFPFDMLRHSSAYPADTTSAMMLGRTDRRRIALRGGPLRHISPERWASFGWPIVEGFENGWVSDIAVYRVGVVEPA